MWFVVFCLLSVVCCLLSVFDVGMHVRRACACVGPGVRASCLMGVAHGSGRVAFWSKQLRRSQFLHVFGSSPDETAFFRIYLLEEGTINNVLMIQPSLLGNPRGRLVCLKSVHARYRARLCSCAFVYDMQNLNCHTRTPPIMNISCVAGK